MIPELTLFFFLFKTLLDWILALGSFSLCNLLDVLDLSL